MELFEFLVGALVVVSTVIFTTGRVPARSTSRPVTASTPESSPPTGKVVYMKAACLT